MKKLFLLLLIPFVLFSCSNNNSQETVKSYISAHNEHNIEKALTFCDDQIEFELIGVWARKGIEDMRALESWDAALNSHLKLESVYSKGDSVFCRIIENNDWFRAVEIKDLINDPVVFIVANNKIIKIIGYPSNETGMQIEAAIGNLFQWAEQTNDSTIYSLIQNGQFVYSTQAAEKWLELFSRWKSED